MAVLTNGFLKINTVDLSAKLRSFEPSFDLAMVEKTCMNAGGMKSFEAGMEGWSIKGTFLQDFAAGSVHATLSAAHAGKVPVAIEFRFSGAAVSPTNPKLTGNALVVYKPKGGAPGAELEADVELTGDGAYTWATA